jgi:uncharacterized metal-binding protein YceD (DUF177 family)
VAKEQLGPYVVLVRDLPVQRSFDISPLTVSGWIKGLPMRDALGAPDPDPDAGSGHAELELYLEGTHAFATGTFTGNLHVACSRCVGDVNIILDEHLMVTFMPPGELPAEDDNTAGEDGKEVQTEDLDLFPFDGDRIDLEPLFREQFVLSIPYAPLCREDCKGLCGQCGVDLNSGTCTCEKPIDPRLAALAGLRGLKLPS